MLDLSNKEKIIIIRSAYLGDFVVCIPFLQFLYEDLGLYPENVFIVILNNGKINPISLLFGNNSEYSKNSKVLNIHKPLIFISELQKIKKEFNATKIIYLPFRFERYVSKLKKLFIIKISIGFLIPTLGFKSDNTKYNISQYFHLFDYFGVEFNKHFKLRLPIIEENVLHNYKKKGKLLIALYPNSKLKMKIWSIENYRELIENILKLYDVQILIVGSQEDYLYNEKLKDSFQENENVVNIAGKYNIAETINIFKEVDVLIGNDGFPLHLAALANTPILGIYTYKNPIGCWDPIISDKIVTIRTLVTCKECYKSECGNPVCITNIFVTDVLEQFEYILKNHNKSFAKLLINQPRKALNWTD